MSPDWKARLWMLIPLTLALPLAPVAMYFIAREFTGGPYRSP